MTPPRNRARAAFRQDRSLGLASRRFDHACAAAAAACGVAYRPTSPAECLNSPDRNFVYVVPTSASGRRVESCDA